MKNLKSIGVFTFLLLSITAIDHFIFSRKSTDNQLLTKNKIEQPIAQFVQQKNDRHDITFILGEDKDPTNPYYAQAENYYRNHPTEHTEWLVLHLRSLHEVRNYLEENALGKWGNINLVVHSNEWTGMGATVLPNGKRATAKNIHEAIENGHFKPLPPHVMDARTELHIHACAMGKNKALLEAISIAFGSETPGSPQVKSSNYFIHYTNDEQGAQRYESDYWYTYFKTGYRPHDLRLRDQLKEAYPTANVDFYEALQRKQPRFLGDTYHYYFNVPVKWVVTYADKNDRPDLTSIEAQEAFLSNQTELIEQVHQLNIPMDKFRWQFKYIDYTFEDNTTEPAILIKGKSSVLCVLKSITEPSDTPKPDLYSQSIHQVNDEF